MLMHQAKMNMKVTFGRANGEKTLGEIIKLNPTKAKVRTLESRGRRSVAGSTWSVPYSMLTPTDEAVPVISGPVKYDPLDKINNYIRQAIVRSYTELKFGYEGTSTEALLRRQELSDKIVQLRSFLPESFTEAEAFGWDKLRTEYAL